MNEEEKIEFEMDIIDQVFGELKIDYPIFTHAAIRCIYEIIGDMPMGIQSCIYADISQSSKVVISTVKEIMIRYFELENFKQTSKINPEELENG